MSMGALVIIVSIFALCYVAMLIATSRAVPFDPSWDYWYEDE